MAKLIACINMTLDGYCDHTAVTPDPGIHQHYTNLLDQAGGILYGRITFQLMEFWKEFLHNPSGQPAMDDFARAIDRIPKWVFSKTLTSVDWPSARLMGAELEQAVQAIRQMDGQDWLVGSPGLIVECARKGWLDEFQICVHPVLAGSGRFLFADLGVRQDLKFAGQISFPGGAQVLKYRTVSL